MSSNVDSKKNPLDTSSIEPEEVGELIILDNVDAALFRKMTLVNDAIDEIGFTTYHAKLFCLSGFGYSVDSMFAFLPSIAAGNVTLEFNPSYTRAGQLSLYVGLLAGALFWGLTADIVGRKWAFNSTLFIGSIFTLVAGAAPTYESWAFFNAMLGFGAGGNLVLDTTVFLEYLPSKKSWLITVMAAWWGFGQMIAAFVAWGFLPNYSCPADATTCTRSDNMGWRYLYFTCGALVFAMSMARVLAIRFHETPKYNLCQNKDEDVVKTLKDIAEKYQRPCSLTVEQLQSCGNVSSAHSSKHISLMELKIHLNGLFMTKQMTLSTLLVWLSWTVIGLAYPLFFIFLPDYISSRGADFGEESSDITWRNYAITNALAIPGPLIAGCLCRTRLLGRRYTMVIGALLAMAFFFAYTAVKSPAQNLGFNCAISVCINIYYGTLYAYTPEVLPSAHRATGNGISVALNRFMGIISVVVASVADTASSVPIYLCAALCIVLAIISVALPFESAHRRSI